MPPSNKRKGFGKGKRKFPLPFLFVEAVRLFLGRYFDRVFKPRRIDRFIAHGAKTVHMNPFGSILVDWQIRDAVRLKTLEIEPFEPMNVGPNSYDITLDGDFVRFEYVSCKYGLYDLFEPYDPIHRDDKYFNKTTTDVYHIYPQQVILGSTVEYFKIKPGFVAFVHGRSSWARLGLQIHAAGLLDSGWEGNITLEIVNFAPFPSSLRKGDKIGQVTFHPVERCETPYNARRKSKYDKQTGATASRIEIDYGKED